jgi:eukaryotic-like serine/threonine-protein kinase
MRPKLAKYEILGGLATGGMADVWLARAQGPAGFEKVVVLKTIRPLLVKEPGFVDMFFQEARVAARLNHPNCVQIFDVGQEGDTPYIAMEFIDGFSLSRVFKRSKELRIPIPIAGRIFMDAASGLDHAHRLVDRDGRPLGLVHRDVSPDNILISFSGQTKLVDFGIVKASAPGVPSSVTRTGSIKGKHGYMAPEYLRGVPIDGRADLFALGVVLYKALTGVRPFNGATDTMIARAVMDDPPVDPHLLNAEVSADLEAVVLRALAKAPEQRFENARAFRTAMEQAVGRPAGSEQVAEFMEASWPPSDPERIGLERLATGRGLDPAAPLLEPVFSEDVSLGGFTAHTMPERGSSTWSEVRRPRHWLPAAVGVAVVLLAAAAFLVANRSGAPVSDRTPTTAPTPLTSPTPEPKETQTASPQPVTAAAATAPTPATPKPTQTTKGKTGRVEIVSALPADVLFRSKRIGRAPGTFDLPVGHVALRVVNRDLGLDREVEAAVTPGRTIRATVDTAKAWLLIRVSPWAEVKLDGKALGSTPVPEQEVFAGRHVIDLSDPDLNRTRRVTVELSGGEHRMVRESFE